MSGMEQLAIQVLGSIAQAIQATGYAYPNNGAPTSASASVTNASAVATLATSASETTWITGFDVTGSGATGANTVVVTVTGPTNTLNFTYCIPASVNTQTRLEVRFPYPIPASAVNTAIVVTVPAVGAGDPGTTVSAYGFLF